MGVPVLLSQINVVWRMRPRFGHGFIFLFLIDKLIPVITNNQSQTNQCLSISQPQQQDKNSYTLCLVRPGAPES